MNKSEFTSGRCVYCGCAEMSMTTDHVVPLSRWIEFRVKRRILNNKSNRVVACRKCNAEKGNMPPKDWFALHPEYQKRFAQEAKYLSKKVKDIAGVN